MAHLLETQRSEHHFHIPVMGTGFTNTTALEVAPLGVSSVIALADDTLLEQSRAALSKQFGLEYQPIGPKDDDFRARRTQAFLDLIADEVERRFEQLRTSPFVPGSPIQRYFELLPETATKAKWRSLSSVDPADRSRVETELRASVIAGHIEANIMTKLDSGFTLAGEPKPPEQSDALSSMRGFATSKLRSTIVLSAGMNQRLFAYMATLEAFYPNQAGVFEKKLCLKVSDFRSADIQGMMLAKKGLWVSEYRIESGLNCGGHAFPTDGQLMGPILDEFLKNRKSLTEKLYATFAAALRAQGRPVPSEVPSVCVTVQGGVGTALEHKLLLERYKVDSVGWGSAFLFCPEVISIDEVTLNQLLVATRDEVQLSKASPLGVPFWNLTTSKAEQARKSRNESGKSGSSCPRGILAFDTEFSDYPICTASRRYHLLLKDKVKDAPVELARRQEAAEGKACLCGDLAGSAQIRLGIDPEATPLICPGPNSVYFRRVASFDEMVGHIYGRNDVLPEGTERPHFFLNELEIYVEYLEREIGDNPATTNVRLKWVERYKAGLAKGIEHIRELISEGWIQESQSFIQTLGSLEARLLSMGQAPKPMHPPSFPSDANAVDSQPALSPLHIRKAQAT